MKARFCVSIFCVFVVGALLNSRAGLAAEIRVIEPDSADLRQGPGPKAPTVGRVTKGTWVAASNLPVEGYFKIRTDKGRLGWVKGEVLVKPNEGFVDSPDAPLMANAQPKAAIRLKLAEGTMVSMLPSPVGGFYSVRLDSGETGWLPEKHTFVGFTAQILGPETAVRAQASKVGKALFDLPKGEWIYSNRIEKNGHMKIRTEDGRVGWMNSASLRFGPKPKAKSLPSGTENSDEASDALVN